MANLEQYWSASTARLPDDKDPSNYAIDRAPLFPARSVIADLGGGSGEDATLFATLGHMVYLLDINEVDLAKTFSRAQRFGVTASIKMMRCDMNDGKVPLPDNTFDIVYSRLTLHFFDETTLASLFREIMRILKPSGKTYMTLKSPDDTEELTFLKLRAKEISPGVFDMDGMIRTRFNIEQLRSVAQKAGLDSATYDINPYTERLGERNDKIKSNVKEFLLNEVVITKAH